MFRSIKDNNIYTNVCEMCNGMKCKSKTYLICINETSFEVGGFHMNLYCIIFLSICLRILHLM